MDTLNLTPEETLLRNEIQQKLKEFPIRGEHEDRIARMQELRDLAVKLHKSLQSRGIPVKHHGYMIENRGCPPDDPEFYIHVHPIEDLIAFTYNPHANDDPEDKTVNHDFEIKVYTRRWGHDDVYKLTRTETGWYFEGMSDKGPCDKGCAPLLYINLGHDSVQYPVDVEKWFEWLWEKARERGLSHEQVQQALNEIADWINVTEKHTPDAGAWGGLA